MPAKRSKPESHTAIARAVERLTGTEPVRGEDLLPPELKAKYLAAKKTVRRADVAKPART